MNEVTCYTCNKPINSEADITHWGECGDHAWCQECIDAEVTRAEAIPLAELANLVEHAAENQSVLDPYIAMRIAELLRELPQIQAREKALREDALKAIDAAIQCEGNVLDVYRRRVSLTTLDLAVADMKQDSLPKLKAARTQAGEE